MANSLPSLEDYLVHPTTNLAWLDLECHLDDLVINKPKGIDKIDYILNNSFRMLVIKPEQAGVDSMNFLCIIMELQKAYRVVAPGGDHLRLATLSGSIAYLEP